jgi:hypothetical protein
MKKINKCTEIAKQKLTYKKLRNRIHLLQIFHDSELNVTQTSSRRFYSPQSSSYVAKCRRTLKLLLKNTKWEEYKETLFPDYCGYNETNKYTQ